MAEAAKRDAGEADESEPRHAHAGAGFTYRYECLLQLRTQSFK